MKNSKYKGFIVKTLCLLLLCTLVLPALPGCSRSVTDGVDSTEEDLRVVGTVGEYEVLYDEYKYVVLTCKDILCAEYGKDIWSTPDGIEIYSPILEYMVSQRITANYAVLKLCEANGYKDPLHDKDAVKYVNAQIDNTIYNFAVNAGYDVEVKEKRNGELKYKYGSGELKKAKELFQKALAEDHITERVMRLTLGVEYAFQKLSTILTVEKDEIIHTAEDIESFMMSDDFICTKHVFIEKTDDKSLDELRDEAEAVYQMYLDGSSMNSLIGSKYNKDVAMPYEGYYFTFGEMEEAYEAAAFALEVGEVSEVVETKDGLYIIQRCPKNTDYMLDNLETFAQQIIYSFVNTEVRLLQDNLELEKNEFGASLVLNEMTDAQP